MPRSVTFAFAIGLAALIVLAGSSALSFEISSWNRVKPGVTVLDVSVGGLSLDEAQARLAPRALAILDQPVQVQLDQQTWTTSARQLGVRLDPAELAQAAYAVGRDGPTLTAITAQLDTLREGYDIPVIGQADGSQVDGLVQQIARQVDRPAQPAV